MVDYFLEILLGVDSVISLNLDLLRVHARVVTGAGALAVEHEHLLANVYVDEEVPSDEAEHVMEFVDSVALEDDKKAFVEILRDYLILNEVQNLLGCSADWLFGFGRHLDVVEANALDEVH